MAEDTQTGQGTESHEDITILQLRIWPLKQRELFPSCQLVNKAVHRKKNRMLSDSNCEFNYTVESVAGNVMLTMLYLILILCWLFFKQFRSPCNSHWLSK
ncbi:hypothetical protein DPMN_012963 [Dreissena polymorpha]|uniref:Uncharacterized protein n=1 Tax=Dreissena polymorpha TaxID=45954 RepID=A0A9D4N3E9_DREPO|nr:hypothetical protein DPMN_012963 [Dreissena polymorpha]